MTRTRNGASRRRIPQYSLRTALCALTLVCIWLGVETCRARRQKRAMERIDQLGGSVFYDYEVGELDGSGRGCGINPWAEPSVARWLIRLCGVDLFARPAAVDFEFSTERIDDSTIKILRDLPALKCLHLGGTDLTARSAELLASLRNLRFVRLPHTMSTDDVHRVQKRLPRCIVVRDTPPSASDRQVKANRERNPRDRLFAARLLGDPRPVQLRRTRRILPRPRLRAESGQRSTNPPP